MTSSDLEAADEIAVAAYGGGLRRGDELARYLSLQPTGWLLAVRDGTPVGLGGAVMYGPFAYIGLMAVHPSRQRQGIAQAILGRLLAWLQAEGCPIALLDASAMGQSLYARLGFIEDDKVVLFSRDDIQETPPPAAPPVVPACAEDLPALVAFDTPIFGASRERVLASYLAGNACRAFLTYNNTGAMTGYLVAQERTLGPWVARSPEAAGALLAHAMSRSSVPGLQALVPTANHTAPALLERYGFKAQRTLSHMRLGGTGSPVDRALVYGQASFALG